MRLSISWQPHCVVGWNWCYRCYCRGFGAVWVLPRGGTGGTDDAAVPPVPPPSSPLTLLNPLQFHR